MTLQVSSSCPNDVEIGFNGHGGWLKSNAPGNSEEAIIEVTGKWKFNSENKAKENNLRLESRTVCEGHSLTIHRIQLIGHKPCKEGKFLFLAVYS